MVIYWMLKRIGIGIALIGCGLAVSFLTAGAVDKSKQVEPVEDNREASAKDQRNAQSVTSVYAIAMGADSEFPPLQTKHDVVEAIRDGVTSSKYPTNRYTVPNITDSEAAALAEYLSFDPETKKLTFLPKRQERSEIVDSLYGSVRPHMEGREVVKHRRNARIIASVYASAVKAGTDFDGANLDDICGRLNEGVVGTGRASTTTFRVPRMSAQEIAGAQEFLAFDAAAKRMRYESRN